jgi:hypothetical protein
MIDFVFADEYAFSDDDEEQTVTTEVAIRGIEWLER